MCPGGEGGSSEVRIMDLCSREVDIFVMHIIVYCGIIGMLTLVCQSSLTSVISFWFQFYQSCVKLTSLVIVSISL